jgi:hypothetical protein
MRFALLFLHVTFGSLNAFASSSALLSTYAWASSSFKNKTLLVFPIDMDSSHFLKNARSSMVVSKPSHFRLNKLCQNSALGSYPCKKLLFLSSHCAVAAQVICWPGCDFDPGPLHAIWCTAMQSRATPCIPMQSLAMKNPPKQALFQKGGFKNKKSELKTYCLITKHTINTKKALFVPNHPVLIFDEFYSLGPNNENLCFADSFSRFTYGKGFTLILSLRVRK